MPLPPKCFFGGILYIIIYIHLLVHISKGKMRLMGHLRYKLPIFSEHLLPMLRSWDLHWTSCLMWHQKGPSPEKPRNPNLRLLVSHGRSGVQKLRGTKGVYQPKGSHAGTIWMAGTGRFDHQPAGAPPEMTGPKVFVTTGPSSCSPFRDAVAFMAAYSPYLTGNHGFYREIIPKWPHFSA